MLHNEDFKQEFMVFLSWFSFPAYISFFGVSVGVFKFCFRVSVEISCFQGRAWNEIQLMMLASRFAKSKKSLGRTASTAAKSYIELEKNSS